MIREGTLQDVAAFAALRLATFPNSYGTEAGIRARWTTTPERARTRRWALERSGSLVGWASAGLNPETSEKRAAFANVVVHPSHRRRGFGTSLWNEVEAHLLALDARHVSSHGADDVGASIFMEARGFTVTFVDRTSGVDPRAMPPPPPLPDGVELRTFATIDEPRLVFELEVEALQDVPVDQPFNGIRYDEWLERTWHFPELDGDCSMVAFVDGQAAGFTTLFMDPATLLAATAMTGVARRFRGRGLAELVKRHSLAAAAVKGVTMALTDNDESNAPMLAVNAKLGYHPVETRLIFSRRS